MKNVSGLSTIAVLALLGCGPSEEQTDGIKISTGEVDIGKIVDDQDKTIGYYHKAKNGEVDLYFGDDRDGVDFAGPLDIEVEGELYPDAVAYLVGYSDFGTVIAGGKDGNGDPFAAVSPFNFSNFDYRDTISLNEGSSMSFQNVDYAYIYVTQNGVAIPVVGSNGELNFDSGAFDGNFGNGQVTVSGDLEGFDLVNGTSVLRLNGQSYPGDVEGILFYAPEYDSEETWGSFVSSDASDEVLYSGAWAGVQ